jgi:hypothetical protein
MNSSQCHHAVLAKWRFLLAVFVVLPAVACAAGQVNAPAQKYPATIVFMTDFGLIDDSVAL